MGKNSPTETKAHIGDGIKARFKNVLINDCLHGARLNVGRNSCFLCIIDGNELPVIISVRHRVPNLLEEVSAVGVTCPEFDGLKENVLTGRMVAHRHSNPSANSYQFSIEDILSRAYGHR